MLKTYIWVKYINKNQQFDLMSILMTLTSLHNPAPFDRRGLLLVEKETRKYSAVFSKQVTHVLRKWSDLNQGNQKVRNIYIFC